MQQKPREIRIGVIGLGWPGIRHSEAVRKCADARLCAAADLDESRRKEYQDLFPGTKVFSDYKEMIADSEIDAVIICLPNFLHSPVTLEALRAGKHVLCEKPPALHAAEMREIRDEAARRSLVYAFGRQMRFTESMRAAREIIDSGRLGEIYYARSSWVRSRGIPVGIGNWFIDREKAGGGAIIDIGIHALDSAWYLMGNPDPTTVSASVSTRFRNHVPKGAKFDVDDSGFAFLRFGNGAVMQLEVTWAGNLTDDIPESELWQRERISTVIYGEKASLRLDPLTLFEDRDGELVDIPIEVETGGRGFRRQMEDFVGAILHSGEPTNNAEQAVELMEMLDAIYESSARGREIVIAAEPVAEPTSNRAMPTAVAEGESFG